MKIFSNIDIEVVKGDGEDLRVDAVAVESVENSRAQDGEAVSVFGGAGHYYTIIASMVFDQSLRDVEAVRRGYADVLNKAHDLGVKSLALIPFGYEKGVISPEVSAKVLAQELMKFARMSKDSLEKIYVCVTDMEHFDSVEKILTGYLTHVQDTLGMGPYVTVDALVEMPDGLVIIDRTNPPFGRALPGGFVDYGESLEAAVQREVREETGLEFSDIRQFRTYSDPSRDPRFHTVSTVFAGRGIGDPLAGDDASGLQIVPYGDLLNGDYAFDHKKIIEEYLRTRNSDELKRG